MSKEVALPKKEVVDAVKLIEAARQNFGFMQRSWYQFAKSVYMIKVAETYVKAGVARTFQEYVEKEFPTVSLSTMSKFTSIIERWGESIEKRLEKDSAYVLPAYDSCYDLVAREKSLPKEEFSKMKKAVLDNKMTVAQLREKLKEYVKKERAKIAKEVDASVDKIEEDLTRDIQGDLDEEQEFVGDDDDDDLMPDEVIVDRIEDDEIDEDDGTISIESISAKANYLLEALPNFETQLDSIKMSKGLIKLGDDLSVLYDKIDDFLTKLQEKSDEQTVSKTKKGT